MTSNDFITLALTDLDVIGVGETPSAEEMADGFIKLNLLADAWQLERPWIYHVIRVAKTLSAGTASYTIGTGAAINTPRPDFAPEAARLVLDIAATTPIEVPIQVLTDVQWSAIPQKTLTSTLVRGVYYDFDFAAATGFGLVYVWPVPTVSTTRLMLDLPGVSVGQFADYTTDYAFPPGYKRAVYKNLVVELATGHGRPLTDKMVRDALESREVIQIANARTPVLRADEVSALAMGGRHGFDMRLGDFRG